MRYWFAFHISTVNHLKHWCWILNGFVLIQKQLPEAFMKTSLVVKESLLEFDWEGLQTNVTTQLNYSWFTIYCEILYIYIILYKYEIFVTVLFLLVEFGHLNIFTHNFVNGLEDFHLTQYCLRCRVCLTTHGTSVSLPFPTTASFC